MRGTPVANPRVEANKNAVSSMLQRLSAGPAAVR